MTEGSKWIVMAQEVGRCSGSETRSSIPCTGIVDGIVTRKVNGVLRDYYSLRLPVGDMVVMIPTESCREIGVRAILTGDQVEQILCQIAGLEVALEPNWNHRYR